MSNLSDILKSIVSNVVTGSTTGSGSAQGANNANSANNEVSVFNSKEESATNASTQIDDEEYLWWQERLEEKKEEEEKAKTESFDSSKYSSDEWSSVEAKANKNILGNVKDYTFKTSSGTKIDLEDIEGVKILENKQTGEIVVVGANGATINAGNKDAKITIYDSDIKKLDTDKGNDEVKIYNSNVGEITTGRGIDNVLIENSQVEKVNTGSGSDTVNIKDSSIGNANTSSSLLWGVFDDAEDTVTLVNSEADKIKTGRGNDNVIASDSNVEKLKTGSGSDSLSLDKTEVDKLRTNKKDTVVEDKNYLDIDKTKLLELGTDTYIDAGNGNQFTVSSYSGYLLSQEVGFETEEEYQEYVLESLTSNFETMKSVFDVQEGKDGWIAGGYNGLKELTGLGITDKDVEEMIAKQEEMIKGLTAAMNGEGDMTFEEAYEFYTGTTYSKEKIDKYMEVSNIYSAMMVGCQYDENYMEEFEAATGMSVEDVTKEYALCQLDTFGKSTGLQDLVEKYAQDQEGFADKLSAAITTVGMTCIVVGAVVSFVFPPAAPVGAALMTAGKYVSLGGMFMDNAMDLVDDTTDKDGLTKEELSENALETGVEVVSYATGRAIGGLTNNINTAVSSAATQAGASNVTSYIAGQAAETTADMILSLGADYAIAQGQSLITTGEFMDSSEYWSLDRFLGEGKNQLIGILTGLSSAKINNSSGQAAVYATAGKMVLDGDSTGARAYLETSGVKVDDTSFDDFQKTVIEANPDASLPRLEAPKENNAPEIEVDKPVEVESSVVDADSQKPIDTESLNTQTPKIEIPKRTSKYKDLSIEEKRQLVNEKIEDKHLAEKFATYPEEKLAQVLDLKDMGLSEQEILWSVNKNLNQQQFNTLTHLLESGYSRSSAVDLASVDPSKLDTAIELTNKGLRTHLLDKVLNLESFEYSRATELLDLGITDPTIMKYVKLDESSYSKVIDLLKVGLTDITDGYEIQRRLNLSDSEFEAEIQKLKQIQSMRQESSVPAEIKPIELSGDEVQELVTYLNKHGQTCNVDDSIEDLAWKWEQVYRTSGYTPNVLNPKIEDAMIMRNQRYTMPDTETGGRSSSSLNRWMFVSDMDSFINGLPEVGGVYSPNRIQSYSTIKHSAETSFSDYSTDNNVKIVVLPANRTTSAFQIENKYNSDCEVIYPSTTQFRVLYKGVEEYPRDFSCDPAKGSHQMYTIYLEEVIPDTSTLKTSPETKSTDIDDGVEITGGLAGKIGIQFFANPKQLTPQERLDAGESIKYPLDLGQIKTLLSESGCSNGQIKKLVNQLERESVADAQTRSIGDFEIKKISDTEIQITNIVKAKEVEAEKAVEAEIPKTIEEMQDEIISSVASYKRGEILEEFITDLEVLKDVDENQIRVMYDSLRQYNEGGAFTSIEQAINGLTQYKSSRYKLFNALLRKTQTYTVNGREVSNQEYVRMSHEEGGLGSTDAEIASGYQALKKLSSFLKEFNVKDGTKLHRADTYQVFNSVEIKSGKYAGQNLMKLLEGHANGTNPIDLDELTSALKQQGIKQESFLSTSIIKQGADECEREERPIIWEFTTQGRTNGAYIDLYAQTLSNEYECLIDQGSKIVIQGFKFDEKQKRWTIQATITSE